MAPGGAPLTFAGLNDPGGILWINSGPYTEPDIMQMPAEAGSPGGEVAPDRGIGYALAKLRNWPGIKAHRAAGPSGEPYRAVCRFVFTSAYFQLRATMAGVKHFVPRRGGNPTVRRLALSQAKPTQIV